nr:apolipoprotein N-acyltransferase [uncultured Paracoccus sp.]
MRAVAASPLSRLGQILVNAALGALAALGQAPWGVWPATLIALAILTWRVGRSRPRAALFTGFFAGLGYFATAMFWITEPFLVEPEIYGWMAPFALIFLAAGGGVFWAVPALAAACLATGWQGRGIAFAAGLVLSDWLRGWIFTGLPWALTGHIWIDTPAGQTAALFGSIGLSALTMLAAALPLAFWRGAPRLWRAALPGAILSALTVALAFSWGALRLSQPLPADSDRLLRLVQPNVEQALKWDEYWSGVFFQRLIDLSAAPRADGRRPDAVIWPETAVTFSLEQAGTLPRQIAAAVGAPVLLGIQRAEGSRYYNSFTEFRETGASPRIYDKFHLVPFGEYIPWGDTMARLGVSAFAAQLGHGYSAGPGPRTLHGLGHGLPPAQVLICYEAIFPQHLVTDHENRPEWLLQVTNDAWFGTLSGPWQHLAQARLRAIESGLPMIRVANTGVSAVIDARGTVRDHLPLDSAGSIDTTLPAALPQTLYARSGNWPALLAALATLLFAARRRQS